MDIIENPQSINIFYMAECFTFELSDGPKIIVIIPTIFFFRF